MSKQLESVTTHGKSYTSEYRSYNSMKRRCYNRAYSRYSDYGGRGIQVCDRWLQDFENFYSDMGDKPGDEYSLDRIDNNGDYSPENCRWATPKQQSNNRRYNYTIEWQGEIKTIPQWSKILGIPVKVLRWRAKKGWPVMDILFKSVREQKK